MNKSRRQDRIMNMSVKIAGVEFKNPVMEASGTFGSGMLTSGFCSNLFFDLMNCSLEVLMALAYGFKFIGVLDLRKVIALN